MPIIARALMGGVIAAIGVSTCYLFSTVRDREVVTLRFPDDQSLGELTLVQNLNCFTCGAEDIPLGSAKGLRRISVPDPRWHIRLHMPKDATGLMHYLNSEQLAGIDGVDLSNSNVRDADLAYLSHLRLEYLSLKDTAISGEGFKYLRPTDRWLYLDIRHTHHLKLDTLAHFRGRKRMSLTVIGWYPGKNSYVPQETDPLTQEVEKVICGNLTVADCGIQIR